MQIIKALANGFRRKLSDLLVLQTNISITGSNIIDGLSPVGIDSCILKGCITSIASGILSWTDGYIYIQGEIYEVAADSITYNSALTYYFEIIQVGLNTRTKLNGVSESHHELRYAQVASSSTPPAGYLALFSPNIRAITLGDWNLIEPGDILNYFSVSDATCSVVYSNPLQEDRQNRVFYRKVHDTLEISASIYVSLSAVGGVTSTQSAQLLFPEGVIAHLNADGFSLVGIFPNGTTEIGFADISPARDGLRIQWNNPVNPITGTLIFIRLPIIKIKVQ